MSEKNQTDTFPKYEPELGQLFNGSDWQEYDAPRWMSYGLEHISEAIAQGRNTEYLLTSNFGEEDFANDTFAMRSFNWDLVDSDEPMIPPNFEHFASGLKMTWYKHCFRGLTTNRHIPRLDWEEIVLECVRSVSNV